MKTYEEKITDIIDQTNLQVEKVKLGDVNYFINYKKVLFDEMIKSMEEAQIKWKNQDRENLVEYAQGKIEAYKFAKDTMTELSKLISNGKRY